MKSRDVKFFVEWMVDSSVVWRDSNSLISDIGTFWIIWFPEACGSLGKLTKDLIFSFIRNFVGVLRAFAGPH